ncbi:protein ACCELERATED CELL DEATH 6-like [Telopea speciosissima]|uniref:protein ACCELERATED CELL DEATH 6-like n=1 Tax=Telopea speciosissima TaxID=54955 RepID=UPI001CC5A6C3|nr:protein ACCELERATED CELL DEATH 6-like [Telopea speciosissima]
MDPDLYRAVTEGNSTLLLQLLEASKEDYQQEEQSDQNMNTLLHIAAHSNNVQIVKVIREKQPPTILRKRNYREDTALHIAARHNNAEVVKYLLRWAKETDEAENPSIRYHTVKFRNRCGNTALHEAVLGSHHEVIEVLMDWDTEAILIKNKRKESPLYLAADRGLHAVLEKMLKVAVENEIFKNVYLRIYYGPDGRTPLHAAVAKKHPLCINILLDKKKELISKADADGRTPLHYAASFGHFEEARCLLQKDTSIAHEMDDQGHCPIHVAASKGYIDIIQAIPEYCPGARETSNEKGQNIVHLAAKNGRSNLITYMLQQKSKFGKLINAKDINGNTPLHLATKNSHPKVVCILMRDNVDMTIMNDEGLTALDIAEKKQMDDTISFPKVLTLTALRINNAPSGRPPPIIEKNKSKGNLKKEYYEKKFKERFSTLVLVATLISTVTFTAGFTIPGGYNNDGPYKGMATLLKKPAFHVFVICNTMALYLSIVVVGNNIWAQLDDSPFLILAVNLSVPFLGIALIMMAIGFAAGLYSVILKLQWLAFLVLVIGAIFLLYIIILLLLFNVRRMSKYPVLRHICKLGFYLMIFTFDRFMTTQTVDH